MIGTAKKRGRPCADTRYKIICQRIENGKIKHMMAVISEESLNTIMKSLQALERPRKGNYGLYG
jgi:hypothetical protein